ncbi:nuclear transport factor 2 family protein [Peribacillus sp. JNUCC 23]
MESGSVLKELLYDLEVQLLTPEIRQSKIELEKLLADDFIEFTSSGKKKNKQDCLDGLATPLMYVLNFEIKLLSSDSVLTIYDLKDETRMKESLRSSVWKQIDGRWQMVFHQGTIKSSE